MMFKWLILLGVGLYGALLIGGEDRGQLRAGLREQPAPAAADAAETVEASTATADPEPLSQAPDAAVAQLLPQQPIRILPPPEPVAQPQPVTVSLELPAEEDSGEVLPPNTQLRWVSVDRANVRNGPSRNASVSGRVEGGEAVLVLWVEESGWARIRVEGDGVDGFVHSSLLTDLDPQID